MDLRSQNDSPENTRSRYERTHETTEMHTCFRGNDKTLVMVYVTDMATDMSLESIMQTNRVKRYNLSHLAVTMEETTFKPYFSRVTVMTTDLNQHTKTDNITLILKFDNAATTVQRGPETKHTHIAKELTVPPKNVKFVLVV